MIILSHITSNEEEAFYKGFLDGIVGEKRKLKKMPRKLLNIYNEGFSLGVKVSEKIVYKKNGWLICRLCGSEKQIKRIKTTRKKPRLGKGIYATMFPRKMRSHLNREHFSILITFLPLKYQRKLLDIPSIR